MKRYLLDTDIVVFLFRNNRKVYNHIKNLSPHQIYISDVTVAELEYGNHCSGRYEENREMLEDFLSQVNIIPFSDAIPLYAKERFRLRQRGLSIMDFDLIIACTSIVNNMIMVTNNAKHFNRVEGITIENWIEE